jgi:flagellum-specific ATP synthase
MSSLTLNMDWDKYFDAVDNTICARLEGKVVKVTGLIAEGHGLGMSIGSICRIENDQNSHIMAEVVGFNDNRVILMPYGDTMGIRPGGRILFIDNNPKVKVGNEFIGRVVDGMGEPIDSLGPIKENSYYPLYGIPTNPMRREPIKNLLDVGIASVNTMVSLGQGQRIAVMSGSGVGKSVLIGMMTRHTTADITVIGLIGERGREVKDFVANTLGSEGLKKSVVVAATSDAPPLVRMRGAYLATTLAEFFRDQGQNVLLIIDSITRFAMSSRDVGLAAGEPPTSRGYTPSFFAKIPVLLERAGNFENKGSITGIYSVLVEGDDLNDPVGDTVRSIVDGHIVLSRNLANRGHFPAVDVLESISRVLPDVIDKNHLDIRSKAIDAMARYRDAEDMISIGAYVNGSDPGIDYAKGVMPRINEFLKQETQRRVSYQDGLNQLRGIIS